MNMSLKQQSIVAAFFLSLVTLSANAEVELKTNQQKYSYAIGIQVANNLKSQ